MKLTKIGAALVLTFGMSAAAMASNTITFNGEVLRRVATSLLMAVLGCNR